MVPRAQKSIFGRKMKNSIFRPKIDPGDQNRYLVKKSKVQLFRPEFAKIWSLEVSKNRKFTFSTKIDTKNGP